MLTSLLVIGVFRDGFSGSNPQNEKLICSCYKSVIMHKNVSKINRNPQNPSGTSFWLCTCFYL